MPGTLVHTQPEDNSTEPNGSLALTETNMTTTVSVSTMVEPTRNVSVFEVGIALFYTVIGGGIVFLAFSIYITSLSVIIWFWKSRKRPQNQGTVNFITPTFASSYEN